MTRSASVPSRAAGLGGVPEIWDSSEPRRAHGPDAKSGLPRGKSRISGGGTPRWRTDNRAGVSKCAGRHSARRVAIRGVR